MSPTAVNVVGNMNLIAKPYPALGILVATMKGHSLQRDALLKKGMFRLFLKAFQKRLCREILLNLAKSWCDGEHPHQYPTDDRLHTADRP